MKDFLNNNVPNLDAIDESELIAFGAKYSEPKRYDAEVLLDSKNNNCIQICVELSNYAINKATAMKCRSVGNITKAYKHEVICDTIYNKLPKELRW